MIKTKEYLVSIITPTYNSEKFILGTIESIQKQTYINWELLITDDCSTDKTIEIIKDYKQTDKRIKLYKLKTNSGAGLARNNSIRHAAGRFIAFCDSDDRWLPNKLEVQLEYLLNQNAGFTYSSYFLHNEEQNKIGEIKGPRKISYRQILRNNYIGCLTAIYDTQALGKMFMPDIRKRQDWVLWINIIKKLGTVQGISEPLAIYTVRKNSISSNKFKLVKYNWVIYNKALGFGIISSLLYMIQFLYFYARKKINY